MCIEQLQYVRPHLNLLIAWRGRLYLLPPLSDQGPEARGIRQLTGDHVSREEV